MSPLTSLYGTQQKHSYFVGIGPICDVEITCIFWPVPPFVSCIKDRPHYYNINFNIHLFSNVVIMTLTYVLYPILVQNPEKCSFWRFISIYPASTHRNEQHHHSTILPSYHLYRANIEQRVIITSIRFKTYWVTVSYQYMSYWCGFVYHIDIIFRTIQGDYILYSYTSLKGFCDIFLYSINTVIIVTYFARGQNHVLVNAIVTGECNILILQKLWF